MLDQAHVFAAGRVPEAEAAVEELKDGRMVVLSEGAGDEVAGYLVAVAQTVTADAISMMLRNAYGMPFVALPPERCEALRLSRLGPPVDGRNFLTSIEAREGVTTGVSAADRARTIRIASDPASTAADIVVPGHIVPFQVDEAGVLGRLTAPEAAVDLVRAAGWPGGAVLCHILDDRGRAPATKQLEAFAEAHGLRALSTPAVLDLRLSRERLVTRAGVTQQKVFDATTTIVTFDDASALGRHYALVHGQVRGSHGPRLSVYEQDPLLDALDLSPDGGRSTMLASVRAVLASPAGIFLYLAPGRPPGTRPDDGVLVRWHADLMTAKRQAHVITQILRDLGVRAVEFSGGRTKHA